MSSAKADRRAKRRRGEASPPAPRGHALLRRGGLLVGLFLCALGIRLFGALTLGEGMDGPGSFRLVNADEGGACRAVLGEFRYPKFIGHQTIALASWLGHVPRPEHLGGHRGRSYCQSRTLIRLARVYSAVLGAATVVLVALIGLLIRPDRPRIAWTAALLLMLSNLHVAYSHSGTVDVPQVFFIYLLILALTYSLASRRAWPLILSPALLIAAVWTKWYVFAAFAYVPLLLQLDLTRRSVRAGLGLLLGVGLVAAALVWQDAWEILQFRSGLLWGHETSRFGSGYGNIGTWRRWARNLINLPVVHIVGIGLPACLFVWRGAREVWSDRSRRLLWLAQAPSLVYLVYMVVLGPVTYYRYYLPLFPSVALLMAAGFWSSPWSRLRAAQILLFVYPLLLTLDSEYNYRFDPRREMRSWYAEHGDAGIYHSFYVVPPRGSRTRLFQMDLYLQHGKRYLELGDYVVLSENWYDRVWADELNGPFVSDPSWPIKTKPEYVLAYRKILLGRDPNLALEREYRLRHWMPEFLLHRAFYGTFQLFIGDQRIYRIIK